MTKDIIIGSLKTLLCLFLSSLGMCFFVGVVPLLFQDTNAIIVIITQALFTIAGVILLPAFLGSLLFKDYSNKITNIIVLLLPTTIMMILSFVSMLYNYTDDTVGFIIGFMNMPGTLLCSAIGSLCERKSIEPSTNVLCILIGLSQFVYLAFAFIGSKIKERRQFYC